MTATAPGMLIGVTLSLAASLLGERLWKRSARSGDLLFCELMLWGWVRRERGTRRIRRAMGARRERAPAAAAESGGRQAALLRTLAADLEHRDRYTHGHSRRVARHAANIARQMRLGRETVDRVRAAGAIHDIGKLHTPIAVLQKPGSLSEEEFALMRQHAADGADMVAVLSDPELTAMVRHHHERLDGRGYPDGLRGEDIPLGARILAVADTFDAITSTRSYRACHTHEEALAILDEQAGTQLDPTVVRAFHRLYEGRRPLAVWVGVANVVPRASSALGMGVGAGKTGAASALIAAGAVAVSGGALATSGQLDAAEASANDAPAATHSTRASTAGSPSAVSRPVSGPAAFKAAAARAQAPPPTPRAEAFQRAAAVAAATASPAVRARAANASPATGTATSPVPASASKSAPAPATSSTSAPTAAPPPAAAGKRDEASPKKRAGHGQDKAQRKAAKERAKAAKRAAKAAKRAAKARAKAEKRTAKERAKAAKRAAKAARTAERAAARQSRKAAQAAAQREKKAKRAAVRKAEAEARRSKKEARESERPANDATGPKASKGHEKGHKAKG